MSSLENVDFSLMGNYLFIALPSLLNSAYVSKKITVRVIVDSHKEVKYIDNIIGQSKRAQMRGKHLFFHDWYVIIAFYQKISKIWSHFVKLSSDDAPLNINQLIQR